MRKTGKTLKELTEKAEREKKGLSDSLSQSGTTRELSPEGKKRFQKIHDKYQKKGKKLQDKLDKEARKREEEEQRGYKKY